MFIYKIYVYSIFIFITTTQLHLSQLHNNNNNNTFLNKIKPQLLSYTCLNFIIIIIILHFLIPYQFRFTFLYPNEDYLS